MHRIDRLKNVLAPLLCWFSINAAVASPAQTLTPPQTPFVCTADRINKVANVIKYYRTKDVFWAPMNSNAEGAWEAYIEKTYPSTATEFNRDFKCAYATSPDSFQKMNDMLDLKLPKSMTILSDWKYDPNAPIQPAPARPSPAPSSGRTISH